MILCNPGSRSSGGVHAQSPDVPAVITSDWGSDSTDTVTLVPGGASPKNSGLWVVITSPSSILSIVTWLEEGVALNPEMSKPDSF